MTLCVEKLEAIAVWLEAGAPEHNGVTRFNMENFFAPKIGGKYREYYSSTVQHTNVCGSACCISGTACIWEDGIEKVFTATNAPSRERYDFIERGAEILGLNFEQANRLFFGEGAVNKHGEEVELEKLTPKRAARTIRHLIKTGEVDWNR